MSLPVARSVADLRAAIAGLRQGGASIGLVPTMGALHDGHAALVRAALARGDQPVLTIFVNPTQFAPHEDFVSYPRDEAGDLVRAVAAGAVLVFAPEAGEMYPPGDSARVTVPALDRRWEAEARPHFFTGVATVVTKLLAQALPDRAYFGEKDYQQLQIVRRLVRDLMLPVEIVGVPVVRAPDGLALSSRNAYLSADQRARAATLPAVLAAIADGLDLESGRARLIAAGFAVDYLALVDGETLEPIPAARPGGRLIAAVRLGATRLIDNWPLAGG